ncbi:hypothetical protein [Shimia ponticola]|uniref:hypothetical protein n=1 Tax=Shimia ponticola TaxID=2582893 RepID=UPI0011BDD596|nr:hypothetical protein [Shimia ponticola]
MIAMLFGLCRADLSLAASSGVLAAKEKMARVLPSNLRTRVIRALFLGGFSDFPYPLGCGSCCGSTS